MCTNIRPPTLECNLIILFTKIVYTCVKFIALSTVAVLAVSSFYRHRVKTIEQSSVMPWSALGECTGWSVIHSYYLTYLRESRDKMSCRLSNNVAI